MKREALKNLWRRCLACEVLSAEEDALLDRLLLENSPLLLEVSQELPDAHPFAGLSELVAKAPTIPAPVPGAIPTEDELVAELKLGSELAVSRFHRGRFDRSDLVQEIIVRALKRVRKFRHGGKRTLREYAYMSCYFTLRDIQREDIKRLEQVKSDSNFSESSETNTEK